LVIGGSGLVGETLIHSAREKFSICATYNQNRISLKNINSISIDLIKNKNAIIDLIHSYKPNFVVHTVAYPSVDLCETDKSSATLLHVTITKDIANVCEEINSKLIYLSTDAIFPGELNKKYTELDKPNPVNYYGMTKLNAEKIVLQYSSHNVVLRPAVIYGFHKRSRFTNWIIDSLKHNIPVDPHNDQFNTPTLVYDLVRGIIKIIENDLSGIFHSAGKTCLNRYEFAMKIGKKFNLDTNLIKGVTSYEKKQLAPRPNSTCLNSQKLEKLINFEFSDIDSGLNKMYYCSRKTV